MAKLSATDALAEQAAFLLYSARTFDMIAAEAGNVQRAEKLLLFSRILKSVALAVDEMQQGSRG